jgi:two-component system chemotaxis sensor kinase CheA
MTRPLSLLLVEDSADDAELLLAELKRCDFETTYERVDSDADLRGALAAGSWQLVLCDYGLPSFSALEAIKIVRECAADIPLVILSGTIGEEAAVDTLRAGARDVVLKGNLARLGPVVERELAEANSRRREEQLARKRADELALAKRLTERKTQQLEIAMKYKSEFFANMSHELRTPLNSVLILAGLLGENPEHNLTAKQVEYANVIQSSGNDLLGLIDDLLDLAHVESGSVNAEIAQLALTDISEALHRNFDHAGEEKAVAFAVEFADGLPDYIQTDSARLLQILGHLLDNAFKFTEHGSVTARITPAESGWSATNDTLTKAGRVIAFEITDTGIGMTAETQRRVFQDFVQGDGSHARRQGGTGLGLSLSRGLMPVLGGEITVTSSPGEGSTFTLYLPATPSPHTTSRVPSTAPPTGPPAEEPRLAYPADAGITALVIDDDARNILALTAVLERANFEVLSTESGADGVSILQQTPDVDIALVDIMMPVMDGYETIQAIRDLPKYNDLPILAVTAKVGEGELQRCVDAGASAYISKPLNTANLMRVLGELLPEALLTT